MISDEAIPTIICIMVGTNSNSSGFERIKKKVPTKCLHTHVPAVIL